MTEPLNVASCGECFESFVEPVGPDYSVIEEVQTHIRIEGHRQDVTFGVVEE